jgi:signal transduction histidine kinase
VRHHQLGELIALPPGFAEAAVLLIGGETDGVLALQQQLEAGHYLVLEGLTAAQVRQALLDCAVDVVIIADPPGDTALAACALIKHDDTAFVPVILIGKLPPDAEETAEKALDGGPDVVLDAWPAPHDLERALHTMLRIKRQTDRRRQQHARDTQHFDRIKTSIIDRVSHELSTPLLQVKSAVALLAEDIYARDQGDEQGLALMATQSVARLENLVSNIRQLARTHHVTFSLVHFEEAADYAVRQLERSWASQGAVQRIAKCVSPNLPPTLSDKFALGHLLQILLDNALRYSPEDAPVYVLAEYTADEDILVSVQDFGQGIPAEELANIFEPFYKVNNVSAPYQRGSGTGLALAGLLAASMHTIITAHSVLGQGSTFSFRLPAVHLSEQAAIAR